MFRTFGTGELLLILAIVVIIFGVGRLPQVGGAIGKALHAFRKGQRGEPLEDEEEEKTGKPKVG